MEYCGAYTPNYGLNKKFVFQHKANQDAGSPIKYLPERIDKVANTSYSIDLKRRNQDNDIFDKSGIYSSGPEASKPARKTNQVSNRSFLNTSIAK